jgi:PPOX class probable F420-dependent enzyme
VDDALMRQRAAAARVARLATTRADGRPHVVPCCFAVEGNLLYTAVDDIKPKSSLELRRIDNLRLHPEVCALVDEYAEDWASLWWIRMDGRARLADRGSVERESALEFLASKYEQYRRRPPPGTVVVVEIDVWRAWP